MMYIVYYICFRIYICVSKCNTSMHALLKMMHVCDMILRDGRKHLYIYVFINMYNILIVLFT